MNTHYLHGFVAAIRSQVEQLEAEITAAERHDLRQTDESKEESGCEHPQEKRQSLTVMGNTTRSFLCTVCEEIISEAPNEVSSADRTELS